ncbi:hypothetical protein [Sporosarcina sp. NPDC096371]
MDEYAKLVSQGVYCESCGCFTGTESGQPTLCDMCNKEVSDAIERGEKL